MKSMPYTAQHVAVNYASEYRNVNGISVPLKRRVYAYDAAKRKIPEPVLVAIDIHDIAIN